MEPGARTVERILWQGEGLALGEFRCHPDDPRWQIVNETGDAPLLVFPRTSVVITQAGAPPVLASPNLVVLYNPGQPYRRALHDRDGDRCAFVGLGPGVVREVVGPAVERFPQTHGPSDAAAFLLHDLVLRHLHTAEWADPLLVEEALRRVVWRALRHALGPAAPRGRERAGTPSRHRELVEGAKSVLAAGLAAGLTLGEVARALHVSAFHLARVFHRETGFTLHGYRQQLRLRAAVERVGEPDCDLAMVAQELGFFDHSHLTRSFRRAFGVPPSALRGAPARRLAEVSRIVQAAGPAPA
jgi:AraC-like DNA-binding protein